MSALANLKLVSSQRHAEGGVVAHRRHKLAEKIDEQIALAAAQSEGRVFAPKKTKRVVNKSTGERSTIEVTKRVKEWFWRGDGDKIHLCIRYGSRVMELAKGKNAIEVSDTTELLEALAVIRAAVMAGELDSQINTACVQLRKAVAK